MGRDSFGLPSFLILTTLASGAGEVAAVDGWHTNAGFTTQVIASDNINLQSKGGDSDVGVRLSPSVGVRRDTANNSLYFQYRLDYVDYFSNSAKDKFRHFLTANWNSELYPELLFLDVKANANQNLIFSFLPSGGDDFNNNRNTTQTFTYAISPYVRRHFKGYADLEVRYTFDQVLYSNNAARDSHSNALSFRLESGREFAVTPWSLRGDYKRLTYEDQGGGSDFGRDDKLKSTLAKIGYVVNRQWQPNLYVGYDNNDYATTKDDPKGVIYGAGVTWTPTPRTKVDVSYGHRYFGNNWYFDIRHRQRKGVLTASLTHEPTSSRDEILGQQTFQAEDSFGNVIVDPATGQPVTTDPGSPTLSNEVYILSAFKLGYDLKVGRRDTLGINGYYRLRDYEVTNRDERSSGVVARWSHDLAANTSADLRVGWGETKRELEDVNNTDWRVLLGVTHFLSQKSSVSFDLRHIERDSNTPQLSYTENRATLTLATRW
ncbi:MAG: TIGR03016 family PEP-CTERM system-associated outer membrane protein [Gammaproteobacteria bacterium]|nr:TIGR03016 family PEP-CTERM system-associated outer membrane protein [Gammaproteobacteria bacterium]